MVCIQTTAEGAECIITDNREMYLWIRYLDKHWCRDLFMKSKVYYGEYSLKHWIDLILKKNLKLPKYQRHFKERGGRVLFHE